MTELIVGCEVAINARPYGTRRSKVKRILKRFVELEDGSKWQGKNGFYHEYPRCEWGIQSMEPWNQEEHYGPWLRTEIRMGTSRKTWVDDLSIEEMEAIRNTLLASSLRRARQNKESAGD